MQPQVQFQENDLVNRSFDRKDFLLLTVLFIVSQAFYALLGVRFDDVVFPGYMQFIDADLLEHKLLQSLWYYHANPPLLNLYAGLGLKLFGEHASGFFSIGFKFAAWLIVLATYATALKLCGTRIAAYAAAVLLMFSPAFLLYENWFMYSLPAAAMLTVAVPLLHKFVRTGQLKWGAGFFAMLALLLLTRSLFHLGWMLIIAVLLAIALRERWRQVALAAAAPLLVVALWYGKNFYYFGTFSASSWMGLGLSNISTLMVPRETLAPLVHAGKLSPYALISRHSDLEQMFGSMRAEATGIDVLDRLHKASGDWNFNNSRVVALNKFYTKDSLEVIRTFPAAYVIGLWISNRLFFSPTSMNMYMEPKNRDAVAGMEQVFNPLLYGAAPATSYMMLPQFGPEHSRLIEVNTSTLLIVQWLVVLGYGYVQSRRLFMRHQPVDRARAVVIGFVTLTAVYLWFVATALEVGENYRYRFLIEPLFMALTAAAIVDGLRAFKARRRASARAAADSCQASGVLPDRPPG